MLSEMQAQACELCKMLIAPVHVKDDALTPQPRRGNTGPVVRTCISEVVVWNFFAGTSVFHIVHELPTTATTTKNLHKASHNHASAGNEARRSPNSCI